MTNQENKQNAQICGDSCTDRVALEKQAFDAIMRLPKESRERILLKFFEKYGMEEL